MWSASPVNGDLRNSGSLERLTVVDDLQRDTKDLPTGAVVHELTSQTRELFERGERVMENLEELEKRAQRATDWRATVTENPMMALGAAFLGGVLLARIIAGK